MYGQKMKNIKTILVTNISPRIIISYCHLPPNNCAKVYESLTDKPTCPDLNMLNFNFLIPFP